jgi:DNA-binding response OmpR family regulator
MLAPAPATTTETTTRRAPTGPRPHVAIIDPDREFVRRLSQAMRSREWQTSVLGELPGHASLATIGADVLLVDLARVSVDPMWLSRQIAETPELAIVACTERSSVLQRVRSLHEGLDGWIAKPSDTWELLARIQAIVRARRSAEETVRPSIYSGELEISPNRYDALAGVRSAGLTTREFEVLELLARSTGVAVKRKHIYAGVWGEDVPVGDRSVDIFVGRIRVKLKRISPSWLYVHTHSGVGYRFQPERLGASDTLAQRRRLLAHSQANPSRQSDRAEAITFA